MKKYEKPIMKTTELEITDIITESGSSKKYIDENEIGLMESLGFGDRFGE